MTLNLEKAKKYILALYIIVFTTTVSELLNRICLIAMVGICGLLFVATTASKFKMNYLISRLLLFGGILLVSTFYTVAPYERYSTTLLAYFSMLLVVFFLTDAIKSEDDIKFFLNIFIIAAVANCLTTYFLVGAEQFSKLGDSETAFRLAADEQNSNTVGMVCAYGAIFAFWFFNQPESKGGLKVWYLATFLLNFIFGLLTGSRKAMIMLVLGIFIVLFLKSISDKNAIKSFFKIIVVLLVVIFVYNLIRNNSLFSVVSKRLDGLISGFTGGRETDNSTKDRMKMIEIGMQVFWPNPFFGQGVAASHAYFGTYSHNNMVELLMCTGFVGFITFYWPFLKNIKHIFKINRREPMYAIALFVMIWLIVCGYGYVFYYSKFDMSVFAVVTCWIIMKRNEFNDKKNVESCSKS